MTHSRDLKDFVSKSRAISVHNKFFYYKLIYKYLFKILVTLTRLYYLSKTCLTRHPSQIKDRTGVKIGDSSYGQIKSSQKFRLSNFPSTHMPASMRYRYVHFDMHQITPYEYNTVSLMT